MPAFVAVVEALMGPVVGVILGAWKAEFLGWFAQEMIGLPARVFARLRRKYVKKH